MQQTQLFRLFTFCREAALLRIIDRIMCIVNNIRLLSLSTLQDKLGKEDKHQNGTTKNIR